ncbi:MAG: hypothetical protein IAB99_03160 [Bacteroidetes bacterium]|uniref:Uncharacterized protein n=1 Tax=Candidatus Cryptobacteroides faecipullorum TaxID=2840764 RepID=A0A9D9I6D1_9BACT|nr:hypothetical protein [Candidatus Cryptobacteroides faecipullorum]
MRKIVFIVCGAAALMLHSGCERVDTCPGDNEEGALPVSLEDVALLLSEINIGEEQLREVSDAVSSSSENGYDEEYTMRDLFSCPGAGVGDSSIPGKLKSGESGYRSPMRDMIREHLLSGASVLSKSMPKKREAFTSSVDVFLKALESSDIQIYWPFSEDWDGESLPVITFDPCDGSETNIGYRAVDDGSGVRTVEEVIVDERFASEYPVWVVNRNDDAGFTSLEMLRRQDPEWGTGGGSVIVKPQTLPSARAASSDTPVRTLILKDFTMLRNYDPWFAGASEFFVKIGSVEDFTASTEAELKLYNPAVTDFMIVVKRKYVGKPRPFNAVLVSEWTDQLEKCALMITEDDGGTRTSWKCSAVVKVASKSYGFEINLPFNTRDDIVWRGQLSRRYLEANDCVTGHFGDVDLTFEIREYPS